MEWKNGRRGGGIEDRRPRMHSRSSILNRTTDHIVEEGDLVGGPQSGMPKRRSRYMDRSRTGLRPGRTSTMGRS